jgi:hypothetical protein
MRFPRWVLVTLIVVSVAVLLAVPAWIWIDMPRRMAARLVTAIETDDFEEANELVTGATFLSMSIEPIIPPTHTINIEYLNLVVAPRNLRELILGHQRLVVYRKNDGGEFGVTCVASWKGVTTDWSVLDADTAKAAQHRSGNYHTDALP